MTAKATMTMTMKIKTQAAFHLAVVSCLVIVCVRRSRKEERGTGQMRERGLRVVGRETRWDPGRVKRRKERSEDDVGAEEEELDKHTNKIQTK
jgi:hypothetical protein